MLYIPFLISFCIGLGVGKCEHTIKEDTQPVFLLTLKVGDSRMWASDCALISKTELVSVSADNHRLL